MEYRNSKTKGFTLVELLVVMVIIILMTAAMLMNQQGNKDQTYVDNATRQVASQLRSLQNDALTGKIDDPAGTPTYISEAIMNVSDESGTFQVRYNDETGNNIIGLQRDVTLKNAVIDNDGSAAFEVPSATYAGVSFIQIKFGSAHSTVCIKTGSGNITEIKGGTGPGDCP